MKPIAPAETSPFRRASESMEKDDAFTFSKITPETPPSTSGASAAVAGSIAFTSSPASRRMRARFFVGDAVTSRTGLRPSMETMRRTRLFSGTGSAGAPSGSTSSTS